MESRRVILPNLIRLAAYVIGLLMLILLLTFMAGNYIETRLIAYLDTLPNQDKILHLMDIYRGLSVKASDEPVSTCCMALSPDGTQIAFNGRDYHPFIWNWQTDTLVSFQLSDVFFFREWSRDGSSLFGTGLNSDYLYQVDLQTQAMTQLTTLNNTYMSLSPDDRAIVFSAGRQMITGIYKLDLTGKTIETLPSSVSYSPVYSPDGKQIIFISTRTGNAELYVMNSDGTGQKPLMETGNEIAFWPLWSPNGKHILVETFDTAEWPKLYIMDADGSNRWQLPVNTYPSSYTIMVMVSQLCWIDNTHVLFGGMSGGGAETHLLDVNTGEAHLILQNHYAGYSYVSCRP